MSEQTIPQLRAEAATRSKHARTCKKPIDGCETCKATIAWYGTLAGPVLSQVLQDTGKPVKQGAY